MRSAARTGVIPLSKKRLQITFMFSPISVICFSGNREDNQKNAVKRWKYRRFAFFHKPLEYKKGKVYAQLYIEQSRIMCMWVRENRKWGGFKRQSVP